MDNAPKGSKSEENTAYETSDGMDIGPASTSEEQTAEDEIEDFQVVSQSKRSNTSSIVAICVSCCCVTIMIVFLCLFLVNDRSATKKKVSTISSYRNKPMYEVCRKDECKKASKFFLSYMNRSANPCNDFFNYVCGGWLKNNRQLFTGNRFTVLDKVSSKISNILINLLASKQPSTSKAVNGAKRLFKMCIEKNTTERRGIRKVVKDFGGFPLFKSAPYNGKIRWYTRLATAIRQYSMHEMNHGFSLGAILNMEIDDDSNIKIVKPPETLYDAPSHYRNASYKNIVHDKLCLVLEDSCTHTDSEKISKQVDKLMDFQTKLSEFIQVDDEEPEKISIGKIEKLYPELHVHKFLREVFLYSPVVIDDQTIIIVSSHSFLRNLAKLMRETEPSVVDNLIGLFILSKLVFYPEIPSTFSLYGKNTGKNKDHRRSEWCLWQVRPAFKHAIGRLFVKKYFDRGVRNTLLTVISHMRKSYIKMIKESKWLEEKPKKMAIKKIQKLVVRLGYAAWIMDDQQLDKYYSKNLKHLDDGDTDTLIERMTKMFMESRSLEFLFLSNTVAEDKFKGTAAMEVNAYYNNGWNTAVIPFAMYVVNQYWFKTIKALKYSSAAITIGHEMGHALDQAGVERDYKGDRSDWMNGKSLRNFKNRSDCLIKQYGNVIDHQTHLHLNSIKTLGEDISDNTAVRLVYNAYMLSGPRDQRLPGLENINDKQLLFIGAMTNYCAYYNKKGMSNSIKERHSPNKYRLFLPASNFDAFAKVFKCPKGSVMNKKNKCAVW